MLISHGMLVAAAYALKEYMSSGAYAENFDSRELADIVVVHSAAAGVAAMAAGVLPGVGSIIASGIAVGAIWSRSFFRNRHKPCVVSCNSPLFY